MYKKLQFKIILILVSFIISVMAVVGTILLNNVYKYYSNEFTKQLDEVFDEDLINEIKNAMRRENYSELIYNTLYAYSGQMGIDLYRNWCLLSSDGEYIVGSDENTSGGFNIEKTSNLISAISGTSSSHQYWGSDVMDWAMVVENSDTDPSRLIIYIYDTQEEMHEFSWMIFSIIMQSLLIGLVIAVILSFFLSKAITSPIKNITDKATRLAEGDFSNMLSVYSEDEIGTLTVTFNKMASELKTTLDEISTEREKLQTIFSYLNDGVIAFDSAGNLLHINPTAAELMDGDKITLEFLLKAFGLEEELNWLYLDEDREEYYSNIQFKNRFFDISLGHFSFNISEITFKGYIAVIHDVTEHYELEKSRREFIATVSHELGTPLTGIKGAAETIINNTDMPNDVKSHFLGMIIGESDRMTRLVKDLLVLSRLDNNRMMWKLSEFSLISLLQKCCDLLTPEAQSLGHKISLNIEENITANVLADKERVEQIFINITQNALKYTPENGDIKVSLRKKDEESFEIKVSDNGMGIPNDDLPHIFERFYRVDKARSSDRGGTGLGLAIAKEIVLGHGGDISIDSKLGDGTTVTVILPAKARIKEITQ